MITLSTIYIILSRYWKPLVVLLFLLFVLAMFGRIWEGCGGGISRKAEENLNKAGELQRQGDVKQGEVNILENLRQNANSELEKVKENLSNIRNANYSNINAADLERRAREYENR